MHQSGVVLKEQALEQLKTIYESHLETEMGRLHEQFALIISESRLPLVQVALVLDILKRETIDTAVEQYLGD